MITAMEQRWRDSGERRTGGDRRVSDRRRLTLLVPSERRVLPVNRRGERRQGATVLTLPRPSATPSVKAILAQAVQRVHARGSAVAGDAASAAEMTELLGAIECTVGTFEPPDDRLRSALGRGLLDAVRAEVVHAAAAARETRSDGLWLLLEAFEELRALLEPGWHQQFASTLAGPDALEMLMEVAHDLRSPLTSVLFLAEVLAEGHSGPVNNLQRRQLGLIYSAALKLTELAGNVIELARGGNRLTDGDPAPFSVTGVMVSVRDIVRPIAEEKALEVRVVPPTSDHRMGHAVALSRVLLNLTTNALKFTSEGYVEMAARQTAVSRVEFSVRDTGPGISPRAVESLYSAFRRAPASQGYVLSGTGLGLALCRKLVGVMGGTLQVETREHWGTRFSFELELPPVPPV